MGVLGGIGLFIVLVLVLAVLRLRLVYEFSGTSMLLFSSSKPGIIFYSILVLPGTIIHELSHWLMAEILQVKTGEIIVLPELSNQREEKLGSVAIASVDPIRGFFIGISPFITGIGLLLLLGQIFSQLWIQGYLWWQLALVCYGIMVLGNSMLISRSDRRSWPFILLLLILLVFLYYYFDFSLSPQFITRSANIFSSLNLVLGVTVLFNLVMIGGSFGVRRLVEKLTRRRIIHKS